ncbi:HD domain-containing protein, partial [Candidatus Parcubacteria bacterium]|nr:HD domain-containing protein [Candidatus Parcubacteria bacterium]
MVIKKGITAEEKVETFKAELDRIFDIKIREFTKLCVISAPDYFFLDCPASSTAKYHPIDELAHDGTIIHTKRVFTLVYELCRGLGVENRRDELCSASLIHDLLKQSYVKTGHTHKKHPQYAAELVDKVQKATMLLTDEEHQIIRNCVGFHYG